MLTFLHRKFAEPPRSCLLQPCRDCQPVRDYIPAAQVRRANLLVPLATLPRLLIRASLHSCNASLPSHLARASCNLAGSANPCEFTFLQRKFAKPARSCLLQACRSANPCEITFLQRKFADQLGHAFCNLAGSANPCELTFLHGKFAEPPRSCLLQLCRVC
ncbi:hypothetical protein CDL15_Pgr027140 [Punica granatum]|uniref:Uncharacterized protein n=1 Tax=Punica granatum TaxID=22663 RepID=A0A218WMM7_PUNGR|nr:hypothetical protein CDL15_Pgr027140 [Punica granatum]